MTRLSAVVLVDGSPLAWDDCSEAAVPRAETSASSGRKRPQRGRTRPPQPSERPTATEPQGKSWETSALRLRRETVCQRLS
jgi:hypothetical protein